MATARRRGTLAAVAFLALIGLGAGVGVAVGDALGIRVEDSVQMTPPRAVPAVVAPAAPPPRFTTIDMPSGPRFDLARASLDAAVDAASASSGDATLTVTIGSGPAPDPESDTYRISGTPTALAVSAATEAGAVRGVYDIAAAIRTGAPVADLIGAETTSRLPVRMVDLGAVGVDADPAQWQAGTDYSHASRAFERVYLADAPYVDAGALADAAADWEVFLRRALENGSNAVAWPGAIEYLTFTGVDGVYPPGDPHVARAEALRAAFGPLWDRAAELGIRIFLRTDMPSLSPELDAYFTDRFGSLDTENPALWQVYADALDELYAAEPALSGVLLRIGEGGAIYDLPGWDYYSAIAVRTVPAVRAMLETFLAQAEGSGREVVFRTWSVGIGEVGDMHTDAASYEKVLSGIDSPALIVSTKYTLGDFYSWLPLNDTLAQGEHRRIVEFQSRREFEAFGSFAHDLGREFQWALQTLLAENPRIEGVWTWTQDGGPWRAGPYSLYLKTGFWQLYELNTQLAGALARDPDVDVGGVTVGWAREFFSDDAETVTAIADAMALSHDAIRGGLYLPAFAQTRAFALGLEPPPQMWLFEWDILTGDSATLDVLYSVIGAERVDETIAQGWDAVDLARRMRDLVTGTDAATWRDDEMRQAFTGALEYEADTLELLGGYREMFLRQAQWHDTGADEVHAQWQQARDRYVALAADHLGRYDGDLAHPAWNLAAAELGVERADRDLTMAWIALGALTVALLWAALTVVVRRLPGRPAWAALVTAATRPWRAGEATAGLTGRDRVLLLAIPGALLVLSRAVQTSFLSWTHPAIVLGAWAVFVAVLLLLGRRVSPWPVLAAVGGVAVARSLLLLGALAVTGPGGYWFAFWTDPTRRVLYIAVAFALFVWVFVAAGWALSIGVGRRRATGVVLAAVGAGLTVPALVVGAIGLERALSAWNDEMGLLPWGLARILGLTTYLEIPDESAWAIAAVGAVLAIAGLLLAIPRRRLAASLA